MDFPPIPPQIKSIAHFLKIAEEHKERNIVVSYWACMYACQYAMKSISGPKPPEVTKLLMAIMDWLEKTKEGHPELEGLTSDTTAQALIEEYAIKLFNYAESQDQAEVFDKNTIKVFYTCGILMDILQQFGELSEDIFEKRKYAKWRAAYIHNCLKNGEQPISGRAKVLYTQEEQDEFKEFMSKEDYDRMKDNDGPSTSETPATPQLPSTQQPTWPDPTRIINNPSDPFNLPPAQPTTPFVAPPAQPSTPVVLPPSNPDGVALEPGQMEKAQKYCKWAASALNYDDVKTAIDNLQRALHLLQFGKEL